MYSGSSAILLCFLLWDSRDVSRLADQHRSMSVRGKPRIEAMIAFWAREIHIIEKVHAVWGWLQKWQRRASILAGLGAILNATSKEASILKVFLRHLEHSHKKASLHSIDKKIFVCNHMSQSLR